MRLDKYLKVSRLIKRRTVANEACDNGRISVNGRVVKASYEDFPLFLIVTDPACLLTSRIAYVGEGQAPPLQYNVKSSIVHRKYTVFFLRFS